MLTNRMPAYKEVPLVKQDIYSRDVSSLLESLT
jgi:hypothetical protein